MKNFVLGLLVVSTCLQHTSAKPTGKPCGYGTAEYVLIIGIDGLGGYYLRNATDTVPGLRSFFEQGSYTTSARAHNPTLSGANWGAILTGMTPEETGINNNYWRVENGREVKQGSSQNYVEPVSGPGIPETMFKAAKKQNKNIKTSMAFSWDWIVHLYTSSTVDHLFRGGWQIEADSNWQGQPICHMNFTKQQCGNLTDYRVFNDTVQVIRARKSNLMFSYLGLVDQVGHDIYWGGPEYYAALDISDKYIQEMITTLKNTKTSSGEAMINKTLVMVTADHGGYNRTHAFCLSLKNKPKDPNSTVCASYNTPAVLNIPVLLRGPGIKKKFNMNKKLITNRDLAVTALNALGLDKGEYMTGRVLEEAYDELHCSSGNAVRNERSQMSNFFIILFVTNSWLLS